MLVPSGRAEQPEYQFSQPIKLNPTGRILTMPVPLKDGGHELGEVLVQITPDDAVRVQVSSLLERTANVLDAPLREAIAAIPDSAGFVAIEEIEARGVKLYFNRGLQELQVSPEVDQRPPGQLSFSGDYGLRGSVAAIEPEPISGYLNVIAGVDHQWDGPAQLRGTSGSGARLDLESAVRVGGVVIENRGSYDGDVDPAICPVGASCVYGHAAGLKRQMTRAIYDLPEHEIRLQAGDTDPLGRSLQRSADLLGVSIEKSTAKLNPLGWGRPTASGTFRIERESQVDVIVNGTQVQTLQLRPGNYSLRDLPLSTGANDIVLEITDDTGERRTTQLSAYADISLLAAGTSEWAAAAGVPSYLIDNQRAYAEDQFMATGFYRYGLSDALTGEANIQGDTTALMAGLGLDVGTASGLFGVKGAVSASKGGTGVGADFSWSLSNFSGFTDSRAESLFLNAEYRSTEFRRPGDYLATASGVLYPEFNYAYRFNASYSLPLFDDMMATLSGRYQIGDKDRDIISSFSFSGDRYGADLTLSKPLNAETNLSVLMGYSNELYPRGLDTEADIDAEYRVALRLNYRPEVKTTVAAGYDTLGNQSTLTVNRTEGSGVGSWDTSLSAQARGYEDVAAVSASAGYKGNRAEVRVSHHADVTGADFTDLRNDETRQRTSLRVGTAIAFAGDKIAIGAPVRGGAFAIVSPHDSLADKEISIGTVDNVRAKTDVLGNALVTDIPAYAPSSMSVDVDDLPIGYSLGSGAYDTYAPLKAGYAIEVGSSNSISVYGTLQDAQGQPLALQTGIAKPEGGNAPPVTVFTNAEGKFGAEGLSSGGWVIEMETEAGPVRYGIKVQEGTEGLVKVGVLRPSR